MFAAMLPRQFRAGRCSWAAEPEVAVRTMEDGSLLSRRCGTRKLATVAMKDRSIDINLELETLLPRLE